MNNEYELMFENFSLKIGSKEEMLKGKEAFIDFIQKHHFNEGLEQYVQVRKYTGDKR